MLMVALIRMFRLPKICRLATLTPRVRFSGDCEDGDALGLDCGDGSSTLVGLDSCGDCGEAMVLIDECSVSEHTCDFRTGCEP